MYRILCSYCKKYTGQNYARTAVVAQKNVSLSDIFFRRGINLFAKTKSGKVAMPTSRNNNDSNNHNNNPSNNSNNENEARPAVIRVGDEIHIHNLHIDGGFVNTASTVAAEPAGGATEEYTGLDKPPVYTNIPKDEYVEIDRKSKAEEYAGLGQQTGSSYTDVPETDAEYAQLKRRKSNDYLELIADNAPEIFPDKPVDKQFEKPTNKPQDNVPDVVNN